LDEPPPLGVKLTSYILLNMIAMFVFGTYKAILTHMGRSAMPTTLDWIGVVVVRIGWVSTFPFESLRDWRNNHTVCIGLACTRKTIRKSGSGSSRSIWRHRSAIVSCVSWEEVRSFAYRCATVTDTDGQIIPQSLVYSLPFEAVLRSLR
jgi:hypothetical protein